MYDDIIKSTSRKGIEDMIKAFEEYFSDRPLPIESAKLLEKMYDHLKKYDD